MFEINLSGSSLGSPELLVAIRAALAAGDVEPSRIIVEITETAAVTNFEEADAFARELAGLGCRFALDDFGVGFGFGSFAYVKHLPFDYLKIDGEFVSNCLSNRTDQLVIRAVVDIAQGLGKETVAEFAADEELVQFLRSQGVDYAQGFHVGRPAPLPELLKPVS